MREIKHKVDRWPTMLVILIVIFSCLDSSSSFLIHSGNPLYVTRGYIPFFDHHPTSRMTWQKHPSYLTRTHFRESINHRQKFQMWRTDSPFPTKVDKTPWKPRTMSLRQSVHYFVTYLRQHLKERKIKKFLRADGSYNVTLSNDTQTSDGVMNTRKAKKIKFDESLNMDRLREEVEKEKSNTFTILETLRRLNQSRKELIDLVGYDDALLIPCFTFLTLGALMTSIIPHYYGACVHCLATATTTTKTEVIRALTGLAVSSTLGALFTGFRGSLFWLAGTRGNYNVRVKLHRNLLLQEAAFFDGTETGILLSRLNNDVNKIGMVVSFHVNVALRQLAQFIFGLVYLIRISVPLSLLTFVGIAVVAYVSAVYGSFTRKLAERIQDTFADASAVAETSFSMSETVRAFDGVSCETNKYEQAQFRALQLEEVQAWAYGSHKFVSDTLQAGLLGWLLFLCWTLGRSGGLSLAKLTTFMFYVNFVLESSNEVGDQWAKIQSAIGASTNVFDLIRREPQIRDPVVTDLTDDTDSIVHSLNGLNGSNGEVQEQSHGLNLPLMEFSNMTIVYDAMDIPALKSINLGIYPGDRVAIVGRSGSGKSSMLRALMRFYDPSSGEVKLAGTSLTRLTRQDIAKKVTIVEQEPHLFPATVIENILYGIEKDSIDPKNGQPCYSEQVRRKVAAALEIAALPVEGSNKNDLGLELDTRVGEGGRTLSGGQRQRIAIARALFRQPDVLLLDEPTSALDSKSEKTVVEALKNAMQKTKSMLMITHRLGVIRSLGVNKVVVLERGEIAEMGHPEDLLRNGGLYSQLAREQGILA